MAENSKSIKTDRLIQQSLFNLLLQKPFDNITVKNICDDSLVPRSDFYRYYVDKYELFDKIVEDFTDKFQDLINRRNSQINEDSFSAYLYNQLFADRADFLTLLTIKTTSENLEVNIKAILKNASYDIFKDTEAELPIDFLTDIYAATALTAITWTLKNGYSAEITTFLNDSLEQLCKTYSN